MSLQREVRSPVGLTAGLSSLDVLFVLFNVDMIGVDVLVVQSLFYVYYNGCNFRSKNWLSCSYDKAAP